MSSLNNKFTAKLTTVAPPIKEYKIPVYQDSYILSNNPRTNYGDYNAAQIGNSKTNNAATMIEFSGLKDIPAKVLNNLIDAQVSITYSMKLRHDYSLNVYDYNEGRKWYELTVYWENAPTKGDKFYTLTLPKGNTSTKIDVTDLIFSQLNKEEDTLGLYLDSDDTDLDSPLCMYTKEHYTKKYRPVLTLRYFDVPGVPMAAHINGDITVKQESTNGNMEINGEVSVGIYSVKKDIECKGDDKLIIPKFTVFDMAITNTSDDTLGYEANYDAISNASKMAEIDKLFEDDEVSESASTGDMITGEVIVMTAGGTAIIDGTIDIPKLFTFTTFFLDSFDNVLFSFDSGTNIADAKITMPFDKTRRAKLSDTREEYEGEINGDVFVHGFGGYHYINSTDFAVSNPVNGINDITGTLEVAIPRFSNYDIDNEEWTDFDENNIITGSINITPVVRGEIVCTGKDMLKVPKLFAFNTYLKRPNENDELETVYTFPKGEDIDTHKYTEDPNKPITNTEQDGAEITGTVDSIGRKTAEINGTIIVVLEVPSIDIECDKWDITDGIGYEDADCYILGKYEDTNDNNIISCEKSDIDYSHYNDANLYIKAMISVPTYYDKSGHIIPDKYGDKKDVYRIEFPKNTCIVGTIGVIPVDPNATKDIEVKLDIGLPIHKKYDTDTEEWVYTDDSNVITCEKSDVDYEHYDSANLYVEGRVVKVITGKVTVKRRDENYITGTLTVGKPVSDIDDIICEKSDVDYTNYNDANLYIKGLVYNGLNDNCITEITGTIRPIFAIHEDINGVIQVYARINNGGWIDCDKTEVDGVNVKYTDANMYVVKAVEGYIDGNVIVRGAITAYINSDDFKVSTKHTYTWINCAPKDLTVIKKTDYGWINGTIEVREMVTDTIEGTITVELSENGSYAYIF